MTYHPPYIADNEDGVSWFGRRDPSRPGGDLVPAREARQEYADNSMLKRREVSAKLEHMRPASVQDCPKMPHPRLDQLPDDWRDRLLDEGCECQYVEEGYWHVCKADHPRAVPVWRCEYRGDADWRWRTRRWRRTVYKFLRREPGGVLWGGRPERRATRFDRFISGQPGIVLVVGDWQERPRHGAMEPCATCGRVTLHYLVRATGDGRPPTLRCDAADHYDRLRARERQVGA